MFASLRHAHSFLKAIPESEVAEEDLIIRNEAFDARWKQIKLSVYIIIYFIFKHLSIRVSRYLLYRRCNYFRVQTNGLRQIRRYGNLLQNLRVQLFFSRLHLDWTELFTKCSREKQHASTLKFACSTLQLRLCFYGVCWQSAVELARIRAMSC